jgi:hypothetical protein
MQVKKVAMRTAKPLSEFMVWAFAIHPPFLFSKKTFVVKEEW